MQHIVHSGALFSASLSDLIDRFWRSYALLIDNSIQFYSEAAIALLNDNSIQHSLHNIAACST